MQATKIELQTFKNAVKHKIFSVEFIKQNGELRKMVCMFGVTKHLKSGKLKYVPEKLGYLTVYDMQVNDYRTINLATLKTLTFEGNTYEL